MRTTFRQIAGTFVAAAFVYSALLVAGCKSPAPVSPDTALGSASVAKSVLSTVAPDARLLVMQTARTVEPSGTPEWSFLFGSPAADSIYLVRVKGGQSLGYVNYGPGGIKLSEYANVPDVAECKVDSDEAYQAALEASNAEATPHPYMMAIQFYVPSSQPNSDTVKPMVWYVDLDTPSGPVQIHVDAKTGELTD